MASTASSPTTILAIDLSAPETGTAADVPALVCLDADVQNRHMPDLPSDVVEHIRGVFAGCNARASEKVSRNPNAPEESLDLAWVEHLSRFSAPVALPSAWLVKTETHYLGGMRHFHRWEIADIGVLVHLRYEQTSLVEARSRCCCRNVSIPMDRRFVRIEDGL